MLVKVTVSTATITECDPCGLTQINEVLALVEIKENPLWILDYNSAQLVLTDIDYCFVIVHFFCHFHPKGNDAADKDLTS